MDVLAKAAIVDWIDWNHVASSTMRHAPTVVPRWMSCMLLPARWVDPERAGIVPAWGESMAAEEDSEECTSKLSSRKLPPAGVAKAAPGVPPHD